MAQEQGEFIVSVKLLTVKDGLSSQDVYCAVQDNNGFIWFGTKNGLNRYDGKKFRWMTKKDGLHSNTVTNLVVDKSNKIFIEYGNQWQPFDIEKKIDVLNSSTIELQNNEIDSHAFPDEIKRDLISGRNWRITSQSMLSCFDKQLAKESDARLYVTQNKINQLVVTKDNGVYYLEKGLKIYIMSSQTFFENGNTTVNHFIKDNAGNLWICVEKGIYKVNIGKKYFTNHFTNTALSAHKIPQSRGIWVSEDWKQASLYTILLNALVSNQNEWDFKRLMGLGWGLMGIGDSLMFAIGNQFCVHHSKSFKTILSREICSQKDELINCIAVLNDSMLLLGSESDIILVNRLNGRSERLILTRKEFPRIKSVYRIFPSSKGMVAVAENGLFILKENKIVDYYGMMAKDPSHQLPNVILLDALEDAEGNIWLATNGNGIYRWKWNDVQSERNFENFIQMDGLPSAVVYRIERDEDGNLWLSTDDGLSCFSIQWRTFRTYTVADGLPSQEFNRSSSFKDNNGRLYFGGVNGVVSFDPEELIITRPVPQFHVTGLTRYSGTDGVVKDELLHFYQDPRIQFSPTDYMIQLDVSLLDFKSENVAYWYRIKGVVDEWFLMDGSTLTLGSLPFGSYTVELRALAEGGGNHFVEMQIPIEILQPFYLKLWFFILLISIVVFFSWIWIWIRGRLLRKRNQQLESIVLARTMDLKIALNDKDILLKELHHRVKNNLQLVIGLLDLQKEQLVDEGARNALSEGQMRLSSIAMIHQNFYSASNLSVITFDKFLIDLAQSVAYSFGGKRDDVNIQIECQDMSIEIEAAIPLGLILNELLTNSYKHIPKSFYPVKIDIFIQDGDENELIFVYKDNGPGIDDMIHFNQPKSLGLKLIKGLTSQLRGQVTYNNENGSVFSICFKRRQNDNGIVK